MKDNGLGVGPFSSSSLTKGGLNHYQKKKYRRLVTQISVFPPKFCITYPSGRNRCNPWKETMLHMLILYNQYCQLLFPVIFAFLNWKGDFLEFVPGLSSLSVQCNHRKFIALLTQFQSQVWIGNNQCIFFPTIQVPIDATTFSFINLTALFKLLMWPSKKKKKEYLMRKNSLLMLEGLCNLLNEEYSWSVHQSSAC